MSPRGLGLRDLVLSAAPSHASPARPRTARPAATSCALTPGAQPEPSHGHAELEHQRGRVNTNALSKDAAEKKQSCRDPADNGAEPILHVLIWTVELFLVVERNQETCDQEFKKNSF